jgi:NarL family two-component system response regulator LiaR
VIRELNRPDELPPTSEPLTDREVEVLRLVARGLTNDEIAQQISVSERTVRTHVSNILEKLHLANRTQAALYALRQGIAELGEG